MPHWLTDAQHVMPSASDSVAYPWTFNVSEQGFVHGYKLIRNSRAG